MYNCSHVNLRKGLGCSDKEAMRLLIVRPWALGTVMQNPSSMGKESAMGIDDAL